MRRLPLWLLIPCFALATMPSALADGERVLTNVLYRDGESLNDYQRERCRLDLHLPKSKSKSGFATVVWFHGGGLRGGERSVPPGLRDQGIAVVAANYRLSPRVKAPAYLEDAAAAVAWTLRHIEEYGGDADRVVVSGHSAGGYLATMVGFDRRWLAAEGFDPDRLAGVAPYSGQMLTHHQIRVERGLPRDRPLIDELAPLHHVRGDASPLLLLTGDRRQELPGRHEENALLHALLKAAGHADATLIELEGTNHGSMQAAGHPRLIRFVERVAGEP